MYQEWEEAMEGWGEPSRSDMFSLYGEDAVYAVEEAYKIATRDLSQEELRNVSETTLVSQDKLTHMVWQGFMPRGTVPVDMELGRMFALMGIKCIEDAWIILDLY